MFITNFKTRKDKILTCIIETYVRMGKPVGSQVIEKRLNKSISSATIRNIMSDLEEEGFLSQPHTSAGRVPTDKGYRYYVDFLMEGPLSLSDQLRNWIIKEYQADFESWDRLLERTSQLLSQASSCTGVVLFPKFLRDSLRRIEIVLVKPTKALLIVIGNSGLTRSSMVDLKSSRKQEELSCISRLLNLQLQDISFNQIKDLLWKASLESNDVSYRLLREGLDILNASSLFEPEDKVYLEGAGNILEYPEFKDSLKMSSLLKIFDEKDKIAQVLNQDTDTDEVSVYIGKENTLEGIQSCALVVSNYKTKGKRLGSLGIIGPTRIDYSKAISIVKFITDQLDRTLSKF
jgi:heat-inducible transcriptional repressor